MPFELLYDKLPQLARAETRSIIMPPNNEFQLPAGNYSFVEMFCNEEHCDCRKVIFEVIHDNYAAPWAYINYGWETETFYKKWMGYDDQDSLKQLMNSSLALMSQQTIHSENILAMFDRVLLPQAAYLERVKKHYTLFRKGL